MEKEIEYIEPTMTPIRRMTRMLMHCDDVSIKQDKQKTVKVYLSPTYPNKQLEPELYAEVESFFKWTPTGKLEFTCLQESTVDLFQIGSYYYMTIEKRES